jgi:hypothetical protein
MFNLQLCDWTQMTNEFYLNNKLFEKIEDLMNLQIYVLHKFSDKN